RDRNVTGVQTCALPILLKKRDTEKRKKDLLVNRDKQTTRLGRLVNKRKGRSFREDESFSLNLGATEEEFYQTNNIEPVHYTHVRSEERRVGKESRCEGG